MRRAGPGSTPAAGVDKLFPSHKERFRPQGNDICPMGIPVEDRRGAERGRQHAFYLLSGCAWPREVSRAGEHKAVVPPKQRLTQASWLLATGSVEYSA